MYKQRRKIGIVGGLGPYAGLDLLKKLFSLTGAKRDQDHYDVALISYPSSIPDRTEYILHKNGINPAEPIFEIIQLLSHTNARVIGIPCNSSHADIIFSKISTLIQKTALDIQLVDMIQEVANHIKDNLPNCKSPGILATTGTVISNVYGEKLARESLKVLYPDSTIQTLIHDSIYNEHHGIKAQSDPVSYAAIESISSSILHLRDKGADCIILGCTELPLAITDKELFDLPLIDPTEILAKALIKYCRN